MLRSCNSRVVTSECKALIVFICPIKLKFKKACTPTAKTLMSLYRVRYEWNTASNAISQLIAMSTARKQLLEYSNMALNQKRELNHLALS